MEQHNWKPVEGENYIALAGDVFSALNGVEDACIGADPSKEWVTTAVSRYKHYVEDIPFIRYSVYAREKGGAEYMFTDESLTIAIRKFVAAIRREAEHSCTEESQ